MLHRHQRRNVSYLCCAVNLTCINSSSSWDRYYSAIIDIQNTCVCTYIHVRAIGFCNFVACILHMYDCENKSYFGKKQHFTENLVHALHNNLCSKHVHCTCSVDKAAASCRYLLLYMYNHVHVHVLIFPIIHVPVSMYTYIVIIPM